MCLWKEVVHYTAQQSCGLREMEELLLSRKQREKASPDSNKRTADAGKSTPEAIPDLSSSEQEKVRALTAISAVVV
jgi:hypothetical protein